MLMDIHDIGSSKDYCLHPQNNVSSKILIILLCEYMYMHIYIYIYMYITHLSSDVGGVK